jgi:hypothetical protein
MQNKKGGEMQSRSGITQQIAIVLALIVLSTLPADAIAGMAVSPLKQWVEVKPGGEAFFSVTVTNANRGPETGPCTVYADVVDFTVSPEGQLSFGQEHKHGRSAVQWFSLDAGELILEPGESKELKGKVSAPVSADGDYWAAIMLTLGNSKNQKANVHVILRTASGVFVRVARRNYIEQASITDVNVSLPRFALEKGVPEESARHQASQEGQTDRSLKINARLKNDGLVATEPNGKAFLYDGNSHRIGYIPLYASRRQILPGHTRWFTGVMAQPLAAGQYRVRVFFDSGSKYGRTRTKDVEFPVSGELAAQWAQNFTGDDRGMLELNPQKIDLALNPGRFTVTKFLIANTSSGTISVRCRVQNDQIREGWMKLDCSEFALAPNGRRNIACAVRIPADAQPQDYNATIQIEVERSGLTSQAENNVMLREIPVHILVSRHIELASEGS